VLALQVAPARTAGEIFDERLEVTIDGRELRRPVVELATDHAGRIHVVRPDAGTLAISYRASLRAAPASALPSASVGVAVDAEAIAARRQSPYAPSDALAGFAAVELAGLERGPDLARSVAEWVFEPTSRAQVASTLRWIRCSPAWGRAGTSPI
jgi:hypothetical protein